MYIATRKVTKVARTLAAKSPELESEQKSYTVMALLDGGTLRRHKSWLKVNKNKIPSSHSIYIAVSGGGGSNISFLTTLSSHIDF